MLKKNDRIEIEILRYGSFGEGIGSFEGQTVFVPFALVGEVCLVHIIFAKKNYASGKIVEILKKSPERQTPICPVSGVCGGCNLPHMKYQSQLKEKQKGTVQTFKKVGGIDIDLPEIVASPLEYGYRNKLSVPFSQNGAGETVCGFYKPKSHRVVEIKSCPLQSDKGNLALSIILSHARENGIKGCFAGSGELWHSVIRCVDGGVMIVLVVAVKSLKSEKQLFEKLQNALGNVSVHYCIRKEESNVILQGEFVHKFGDEFISSKKKGISFLVGPQSFLQVNDLVVDMLYEHSATLAFAGDGDVVFNCYSGAGFLSAMLAKHAKKVVGVEIIPEATMLADRLASENGLSDVMQNITGDVEVEFPKITAGVRENGGDVVLCLDPPRKGVDVSTLKIIGEIVPKRIVYISCSQSTLARDLGILQGNLVEGEDGKGLIRVENPNPPYKIESVKLFDMFPQTSHVETVVLLVANKA